MNTVAYLDCGSGISGDMMLAALVDAGAPLEAVNAAVGSLGLPDCRIQADEVTKRGFRATQVTVHCQPEHQHRPLSQIRAMIEGGQLTRRQKDLACEIFCRLAQAEAKVHGIAVEQVHFHEIGAADSIADIVGTAVGWDLLGATQLTASPVVVGSGTIKIAHGECSVPAPATAELLRGVPLAASTLEGELTTPTGAAILSVLAQSYGPMPAMTIERIGYGAGHRDCAGRPNVLRLMVGKAAVLNVDADQVWVVETNLDDLSGEMIGYCTTRLWQAGALDVFITPIQMKKNRPGTTITILCRPADVAAMENILFNETTTFGVRRWAAARTVLRREPYNVTTPWGEVEGKIGWLPNGRPRFAPEFESCRQLAEQHRVPLSEVIEAARNAFDQKGLGIRKMMNAEG